MGDWAESYTDLANFLKVHGRPDEAEGVYREFTKRSRDLADQHDKLAAGSPAAPNYRFVQASIEFHAGQVLSVAGQTAEAEQAYRQSVAHFEQIAEKFPEKLKYRHELGRSRNWLGLLLRSTVHWTKR